MSYRALRLCSGKAAFEAIPEPKLRLDLPAAQQRLERAGRTVVDARVMLILPGAPEITLLRDGRMVFKTTDETAAQRAFEWLRSLLALPHLEDQAFERA